MLLVLSPAEDPLLPLKPRVMEDNAVPVREPTKICSSSAVPAPTVAVNPPAVVEGQPVALESVAVVSPTPRTPTIVAVVGVVPE